MARSQFSGTATQSTIAGPVPPLQPFPLGPLQIIQDVRGELIASITDPDNVLNTLPEVRVQLSKTVDFAVIEVEKTGVFGVDYYEGDGLVELRLTGLDDATVYFGRADVLFA